MYYLHNVISYTGKTYLYIESGNRDIINSVSECNLAHCPARHTYKVFQVRRERWRTEYMNTGTVLQELVKFKQKQHWTHLQLQVANIFIISLLDFCKFDKYH